MKPISRFLDSINTCAREVERSTRRKKRLRREHLMGAFHVARVIANGIAAVVPKAVPVAVVLNGLNETVMVPPTKEIQHASDSESDQ
jgi:hypothetical protein